MISDIARQVLDIIPDHHHWLRDGWSHGVRHCVVDAVMMTRAEQHQRNAFYEAFYDTAMAQYPELKHAHDELVQPWQQVISVNDNVNMRYAGIRTILEKLAARED